VSLSDTAPGRTSGRPSEDHDRQGWPSLTPQEKPSGSRASTLPRRSHRRPAGAALRLRVPPASPTACEVCGIPVPEDIRDTTKEHTPRVLCVEHFSEWWNAQKEVRSMTFTPKEVILGATVPARKREHHHVFRCRPCRGRTGLRRRGRDFRPQTPDNIPTARRTQTGSRCGR